MTLPQPFLESTVFIFGLCIGSFLNVCIYRLPKGKSIVSPPSSCPKCGHKLAFWENIPLLSYLFLKGRCSRCRERISVKYPLVELLTGILFLLCYEKFGASLSFFSAVIFSSALVVITFIDLEHKIIPDTISLTGILVGFLFSFFMPDLDWPDSLLGIILGGGALYLVIWVYYLLTKRIGMGGGDIKLLAMIGAFLGWKAIPFVIFISALAGSIIGIVFLAVTKKGRNYQIPFGPFLAFAAELQLFYGEKIYSIYLNLFS